MKLLSIILVTLLSTTALASGWGGGYPELPYCEDVFSDTMTPEVYDIEYGFEHCMDSNSDEVEYKLYYEQHANQDLTLQCTGESVEVNINFNRVSIEEGVNLLDNVDVKVSVTNEDSYIFENESFKILKNNTYILRELNNNKARNQLNIATSSSTSKSFSLTASTPGNAFKGEYQGRVGFSLKKGPLNYSVKSLPIHCKFISK